MTVKYQNSAYREYSKNRDRKVLDLDQVSDQG